MEEILLYQTYTYARITPFKNYSKFPRVVETHSGLNKQLSYEDKYGGNTTTEYYDGGSGVPISPLTDEIKKKKRMCHQKSLKQKLDNYFFKICQRSTVHCRQLSRLVSSLESKF